MKKPQLFLESKNVYIFGLVKGGAKLKGLKVAVPFLLLATSCLSVFASDSVQVNETISNKDSTIYSITVTEEFQGKNVDVPETYEYEGRIYQLIDTKTIPQTETKENNEVVEEVIELSSEDTSKVPREKEIVGDVYTLASDELVAEPVEYETSSEEKVEYVNNSVNVPDNDIDRLAMTTTQAGNEYELLDVDYQVVSTDEYGVPSEYIANCTYGRTYEVTQKIPVKWQVTAQYEKHAQEEIVTSTVAVSEYQCKVEKTTPIVKYIIAGVGILVLATGIVLFLIYLRKNRKESQA